MKLNVVNADRWLLKGKLPRDAVDLERMRRSGELLFQFCSPEGKKACDLGCGDGLFAEILEDAGATVDAVDVSENALKLIVSKAGRIHPKQDRMPKTKLADDAYDIVAALDLIAELPQKDHRLFFLELARLAHKDGWVLVSTPLDFRSENALDLFIDLAKTELDLKGYTLSFHSFFIRLSDFLKAPHRFYKASRDSSYRKLALENRSGVSKWWFSLNSNKVLGKLWFPFSKISDWLLRGLENSPKVQSFLESLAKGVRGDQALTHVIIIGKRRPLFAEDKTENEIEMRIRKRIWE